MSGATTPATPVEEPAVTVPTGAGDAPSPAPSPGAARGSRGAPLPVLVAGVLAVLALGVVLGLAVARGGASSERSAPPTVPPNTVSTLPATVTGAPGDEVAPVEVQGAALPTVGLDPSQDPGTGLAAPPLTGTDFAGEAVRIGGSTGRPQVVAFLAHWCPVCQQSLPVLAAWSASPGAQGIDLAVVSTGLDPRRDNWPPSTWLAEAGGRFSVLRDEPLRGGQWRASDAYGLTAYPLYVFVTPDGKVAGRVQGLLGFEQLDGVAGQLRAT